MTAADHPAGSRIRHGHGGTVLGERLGDLVTCRCLCGAYFEGLRLEKVTNELRAHVADAAREAQARRRRGEFHGL